MMFPHRESWVAGIVGTILIWLILGEGIVCGIAYKVRPNSSVSLQFAVELTQCIGLHNDLNSFSTLGCTWSRTISTNGRKRH